MEQQQQIVTQVIESLNIYTSKGFKPLFLTHQILQQTIDQITKSLIKAQYGYSSSIYLYKQPLCSFNKLDWIKGGSVLKNVIKWVGRVCLTVNNMQYSEMANYGIKSEFNRPIVEECVEIVVQICQNSKYHIVIVIDYFMYENYRVPISTPISFISNICNRLGNNIYVTYYNTRLNIQQFSNQSVIEQTVLKFLDGMNRLIITVDSYFERIEQNNNLQEIKDVKEMEIVDGRFYFGVCVVGEEGKCQYYVVSRRCGIGSLRYFLRVYLKQLCRLYNGFTDQQLKQSMPKDIQLVVVKVIKQQQKLIKMSEPIKGCQIVGSIEYGMRYMEVFVVQRSNILYRIGVDLPKMKTYTISTCRLPCIATDSLDQDLFFIRGSQLIGYGITISAIKLKYFTLDGVLIKIKQRPWYHKLYEIYYSVIDLFCVKLANAKNRIRVFYIDDSEEYVQIDDVEKFFPAKGGNNVYSDESGVFAVRGGKGGKVDVYELGNKCKIREIKIKNQKQLTDVFFSQKQAMHNRNIYLNFMNKHIQVYNIGNGQMLIDILCQKSMKNFFCMGSQLACSIGSEIKIFTNSKQDNDNKRYIGWKQPVYIPQKTAIVVKGSERCQVVIRDLVLQFDLFGEFYIY